MNSHKNAPLTPKGREAMARCVEAGLSNAAAARQFNTTPKTVAEWVERFRAGGVDGLRDRSSRPLSLPSQTAPATCAVVEVLRRQRHTGKQIAADVGVSAATVSRILRRLGLNRIRDLEPAEPVRRYEREKPGEMIHIDIKKLGRFDKIGDRITGDRTGQSNGHGVGWEFVHVCIDDHSRFAFSQILPDEKAESAAPFLKAAVAYYKSLGVTNTRVMTDNGSCYKAFDFRDACRDLGIKHILMENRNALIVETELTQASGTAERDAALAMIDRRSPGAKRIALGGDKGFDVTDFVGTLRERNVTPHIAVDAHLTKTGKTRKTAIDGRTTRHPGYTISQRIRKRIEEGFGYIKDSGNPAQDKAPWNSACWLHVHACRRLQPRTNPEASRDNWRKVQGSLLGMMLHRGDGRDVALLGPPLRSRTIRVAQPTHRDYQHDGAAIEPPVPRDRRDI